MKLITLSVEGFGSHKGRTEVDFSGATGVVGLYGPTGTGKSFLIGGLFALLYGRFPDYPGTLKDALTTGGTGRGELTATVVYNGSTYELIREVSETSHKATIKSGGRVIAGPKVTDYSAAIESIFGPANLALATWFCTRESPADLIKCTPGERREIFGKLLGLDLLTKKSATFREQARDTGKTATLLESQVAGEIQLPEMLTRTMAEIESAKSGSADAANRLSASEEIFQTASRRLLELATGDASQHAAIDRQASIASEVSRIRAQITAGQGRLARERALADKLPDATAAKKEMSELEQMATNLSAMATAWKARQTWEQNHTNLSQEIASVASQVSIFEGQPGLDAATQELAAQLEKLYEDFRDAKAANNRALAINLENHVKSTNLTFGLQNERRDVDRLTARLAGKPVTPGAPEACAICPLLKEFANIPAQIAEFEAKAKAIATELALIPEALPYLDLESITRKGTEAAAAAKTVAAAKESEGKLAALRIRHTHLQTLLLSHMQEEPEKATDPAEEIRANNQAMTAARERAYAYDSALAATAIVADMETDLAGASTLLAEKQQELTIATVAAESARAALSDREAAHNEATASHATAKRLKIHAAEECERYTATIATAQERANGLRERIAATDAKRQEAAACRRSQEDLVWLAQCFGTKGVQPLIIDTFLPQLHKLTEEILQEMTGGRLRMRWDTQAANKNGTITEELAIYVIDERGNERDAATCSGGETQILQAANRIGLCLWLSELRGLSPRTIIIDEAGNNTDDETTDSYIAAIEAVSNRFDLVLLVTPKALMAKALHKRIELERTYAGVATSYVGTQESAF